MEKEVIDVPEYHMNRQMAESLVGAFIEQFNQIPFHKYIGRMPITSEGREKLVGAVESTPALNHSKKMQFEVPGKEADISLYFPEKGVAEKQLYTRRVFTNYNLTIEKSFVERTASEILRGLYDYGKTTFDAQVICRELRNEPQITAIRDRSLKAGNLCSLMIHFYVKLPTAGRHGGDAPVHVPLFIIPGTMQEDLETLSVYSLAHQHQRPEIYTYLRHGVFNSTIKDKYFECLDKFPAKIKSFEKKLTELEKENQGKKDPEEKANGIRQIRELRGAGVPFLGD